MGQNSKPGVGFVQDPDLAAPLLPPALGARRLEWVRGAGAPGARSPPGPPRRCPITSLLSCTSWSMSCSRNHMTFLRMKVVMRFQ